MKERETRGGAADEESGKSGLFTSTARGVRWAQEQRQWKEEGLERGNHSSRGGWDM